ncbi:CATRA conflict system CASPASE/TPR repeat-associated protein [Catenuloplanes japonicus]|uniref:CATRA conflict system CASPASE/TPR repeat-associated protein n=1 Tax=Catenuloplanes japonicus TaxID=33876 RepID=UPI000525D78F|nr:CATRA conflict system CASPASE/TPR repeat-associated protein [Catenuloplanes japonicus]
MRPDPSAFTKDPDLIDDALDALGDLGRWEAPSDAWPEIGVLVARMAAALADHDPEALSSVTRALEVTSPLRYTELGTVPGVPPPRALRLLHDRLVQTLIGLKAPSGVLRPALPARQGVRIGGLSRQDFIAHLYLPVDARERAVALWSACALGFGADRPIDGLGLPIGLPESIDDGNAGAAIRGDGVQAIVRRDHDHLVLSLAASAPGVTWARWAERWERAVGPDGGLTGDIQIFAGTASAADRAETTAGELPPTLDDYWQDTHDLIGDCVLRQLPGTGPATRRLLVLGAEDRLVSALVWSRGDTALTPFTRYLLHAAKIHHAERVRDAAADEIDGRDLTWLTSLSEAVRATRVNMERALTVAGTTVQATTGPLADDFAAADALAEQLRLDCARAAAATSAPPPAPVTGPAPTVGIVTALPEEFAAVRAALDDPAPWDERGDRAVYLTGTMPSSDPGLPHRVVVTLLSQTGNDDAAQATANLVRSFATIDQLIFSGVAAGVPAPDRPEAHVRKGDVVLSTWNVVDFDHIVDNPGRRQRRMEFPRHSALLAYRVKFLIVEAEFGIRPWEEHLGRIVARLPAYARPPDHTDVLEDGVTHPDPSQSGHRPGLPKIHEGRIGSSNRAVRNVRTRDKVAREHNLRAFDMESAGFGRAAHIAGREWFVIRGISDYADPGQDGGWRRYAAATAAAYLRALLAACPPLAPRRPDSGGHGSPGGLAAR